MKKLCLRAHHLCCLPYADFAFPERGAEFIKQEKAVKQALISDLDCMITVVAGPDQVCQQCTNLVNSRCASPNGNEDQVRKWDAILLSQLGVTCDTCMSVREWRSLIQSKTPFKICARCRWRTICAQGGKLP